MSAVPLVLIEEKPVLTAEPEGQAIFAADRWDGDREES
jgi:hypothetical protein